MKNKGKNNGGSKIKLSEVKLPYLTKADGTKIPTRIKQASAFNTLASSAVRRLAYSVVRRSPSELLDKALTERYGKAPKKWHIVRHGAKRYNEGRQDERQYWAKKGYWVEE